MHDPMRKYEETHERLTLSRLDGAVSIERDGEQSLMGFGSAQTLGPYIEAEASAIAEFGYGIGVYRGSSADRDVMRIRFGHACRSLAVDLLDYASTLTFEHYDLSKRIKAILDDAPYDPLD